MSRYSGAVGEVIEDDGTVVEVALAVGKRMPFWRHEVVPAADWITGAVLKAERLRDGVTQADLAKALGVTGGRVSQIEGQDVSEPMAARYREALAQTHQRQRVAGRGRPAAADRVETCFDGDLEMEAPLRTSRHEHAKCR